MGVGGTSYSAEATFVANTQQFMAAIEAMNKSMQTLNENMSRMGANMTSGMGKASAAVNTHTQRQTILNSLYNTGSQVMTKRYTGSLKGLQDGLSKVGVEMKSVKGINDGLIGNLKDGQQAWLATAVKMDMVSKYADNMSTKLLNVGKNIQWTGRQLTVGLTTVIGGAAAYAISQFNKMDTAIRQTQAAVGSQFMPAIQASATQISNTWGVAIGDAITSLGTLQKALGTTPQNTQALGTLAAQLSAIGHIDITSATNLIRNMFNFSGDNLDSTTKSVQQLGTMVQQTSLNLTDFASTLPQFMPLFKTFGVSLADGASIMAAFKQSGLDASTGLSAMRMMLTRLTAATSGSSSTLKTLKTTINDINAQMGPNGPKINFYNAQGQTDVMAGLKSIAAVWGQIDDAQKNALLSQIGMRGGATALTPLITAIGQAYGVIQTNAQGAAMSTNDFQKAQEIANMSASQLANNWNTITTQFLKTPAQQWQVLKTQINNLAAQLGQQIMPYVLKLVGYGEQLLKWFQQLSPSTKKWIIDIGMVAAALGPVVYMMGQMVTATGALSKMLTKPASMMFNLIARQQPVGGLDIQQELERRQVEVNQGIRSPEEFAKDKSMAMKFTGGQVSKEQFDKYWADSLTTSRVAQQTADKEQAAADKMWDAAIKMNESFDKKNNAAKQQRVGRAQAGVPSDVPSGSLQPVFDSGNYALRQDEINAAVVAAEADSTVQQAEAKAVKRLGGDELAKINNNLKSFNTRQPITDTQKALEARINTLQTAIGRAPAQAGLVRMFGEDINPASPRASFRNALLGQTSAIAETMGLPLFPFETGGQLRDIATTRSHMPLMQSAYMTTLGVGERAQMESHHAELLAQQQAGGKSTEIGGRLAGSEAELKAALESLANVPPGVEDPFKYRIASLREEQRLIDEAQTNATNAEKDAARKRMGEITKEINALKTLRSGTLPGPTSQVGSQLDTSYRKSFITDNPMFKQFAAFQEGQLLMGPKLAENVPAIGQALGMDIQPENATKLWMANFARMSRGSQTKLKAMLQSSHIPMPQDLANLVIAKLFGDLPDEEFKTAIQTMMGESMYSKLGPEFEASMGQVTSAMRGKIAIPSREDLIAQRTSAIQNYVTQTQLALPAGPGVSVKRIGEQSGRRQFIPSELPFNASPIALPPAEWDRPGWTMNMPHPETTHGNPIRTALEDNVGLFGGAGTLFEQEHGQLSLGDMGTTHISDTLAKETESGGKKGAAGFVAGLLGGIKGKLGVGVVKEVETEAGKKVQVKGVTGGIKGLVGKGVGMAGGFMGLMPNMEAILPEASAGITTLLSSVAPLVLVIGAIAAAVALIGLNWSKVAKGIGSGLDDLKKAFGGLLSAVVKPFEDMWKNITNGMGSATQGGKAFSSMWAGIGNIINVVAHGIADVFNALKPVVSLMANVLAGTLQTVVNIIEVIIDLLSGKGTAAWNAFRDAAAAAIKVILDLLVQIPLQILNVFEAMVKLGSHLPFIGKQFKDLAKDITNWQGDLKNLPDQVSNAISDASEKGKPAAEKGGKDLGQAVDQGAQAALDTSPPLTPPQVDTSNFVSDFQTELQSAINAQKQDVLQAFDAYVKRRDQQLTDEKNALQLKLKTEQDVNKQEQEIAKEAQERADMANTTAQFLADRQAAMASGNYADAMNAQIKYNDDITKAQYQLGQDQTAYAQSVFEEQIQDQENALDTQKQNMDDALAAQKQALSDTLDNLTQFLPKDQAAANKLRQSMLSALSFSGGDAASMQQADSNMIGDVWSAAVNNAIQKMDDDAYWKAVGSAFSNAGTTAGIDFKNALNQAIGNVAFGVVITPNNTNTNTVTNSPTASGGTGSALADKNPPGPKPTGRNRVNSMHTGGLVGNSLFGAAEGATDVPAILQTGEYVIQKSTVNKLGAAFLAKLNTGNFDTTSLMSAVSTGGIVAAHTSNNSYVNNQGDVNVNLSINGGVYQGDNDLQKLADMITLKLKPLTDRRRGLQQRNFQAYK